MLEISSNQIKRKKDVGFYSKNNEKIWNVPSNGVGTDLIFRKLALASEADIRLEEVRVAEGPF